VVQEIIKNLLGLNFKKNKVICSFSNISQTNEDKKNPRNSWTSQINYII